MDKPELAALQDPERCVIVIVTWNAWDYLFRCLDALARQTRQGFQIVISDNGDSTPEQLAQLKSYSNLRYFRNEGNLGFAAGNNRVLPCVADCQWIVLLNPDAFPRPDWFEKMMMASQNHPEFAVLGCRLLNAQDPNYLDGDGDCYHMSGYAWRQGHGLEVATAEEKLWEIFSPCAAAAFYRMDALQAVGGFDEDYFCYMEDVDLGFRLRLAGYRCLQVADAEVLHMGSVSTGKHSDFYVYYGHRNLVWTYIKNMPGALFWLFLPYHLALNAFSIIWFATKRQGRVIFKAKRDAVLGLPKMLKKRHKIQANRIASISDIWTSLDKKLLPGMGRARHSFF